MPSVHHLGFEQRPLRISYRISVWSKGRGVSKVFTLLTRLCVQEMFKVVNAITNDLSMYMWGSSISKDGGMHVLQVSPKDRPWPYDELNEESYAPTSSVRFQRGGRELEKGRGNIDCGEFRKDLRDVSMFYDLLTIYTDDRS